MFYNEAMSLARAIDGAVAFFHLFEYPLTVTELWRALRTEKPVSLWDVHQALEKDGELRTRLRVKNGWVMRRDAPEDFVARRQERLFWTDQKFKKALRFVRWMRLFPFVRMVAIGNSVAFNTTHEHSDIDFFIVVERGHLWTARFWLVAMAKLLRQRPQEGHLDSIEREDALCFVYFVTTDALNLESTKVGTEDIYLEYWISHLRPVFDSGEWVRRFLAANAWATQPFPHWTPMFPSHWRTVWPSAVFRSIQCLFEKVHDLVGPASERRFKQWQERILPERLLAAAERPTAVMLTDQMLKFHENDRRAEIDAAWSALRL
jgi:hypothetical protein